MVNATKWGDSTVERHGGSNATAQALKVKSETLNCSTEYGGALDEQEQHHRTTSVHVTTAFVPAFLYRSNKGAVAAYAPVVRRVRCEGCYGVIVVGLMFFTDVQE
jgi:hypothetical protein